MVLLTCVLTAGTGLLLKSSPALADCAGPVSDAYLLDRADLVVVGTIEEVKVFPASSEVEVRVDRIFKGKGGETVFLRTDSGSQAITSVDVEFEESTRYLLYLRREGDGLTTDICSGTRELSGPAPAGLAETLGEGAVPGSPEAATAPDAPTSVPDTGGLPLTTVVCAGSVFASVGILLCSWALRQRGTP